MGTVLSCVPALSRQRRVTSTCRVCICGVKGIGRLNVFCSPSRRSPSSRGRSPTRSSPRCTGQPIVIFARDVVLRASPFDVTYRQRVVETVSAAPDALEFRFLPAAPQATPFGTRVPPDSGFGCPGGPNALRVERRGENEIVFPNCAEFPLPLRRCGAP